VRGHAAGALLASAPERSPLGKYRQTVPTTQTRAAAARTQRRPSARFGSPMFRSPGLAHGDRKFAADASRGIGPARHARRLDRTPRPGGTARAQLVALPREPVVQRAGVMETRARSRP